jgi:hypothetical protein
MPELGKQVEGAAEGIGSKFWTYGIPLLGVSAGYMMGDIFNLADKVNAFLVKKVKAGTEVASKVKLWTAVVYLAIGAVLKYVIRGTIGWALFGFAGGVVIASYWG